MRSASGRPDYVIEELCKPFIMVLSAVRKYIIGRVMHVRFMRLKRIAETNMITASTNIHELGERKNIEHTNESESNYSSEADDVLEQFHNSFQQSGSHEERIRWYAGIESCS